MASALVVLVLYQAITWRLTGRTYGNAVMGLRLVVIAADEDAVRDLVGDHPYEFVASERPGDVMVPMLQPTDLVVAPSYLLPAMPLPRRLRLSAALAQQKLAVVAPPGRSASAVVRPAHAMDRLLGQHS